MQLPIFPRAGRMRFAAGLPRARSRGRRAQKISEVLVGVWMRGRGVGHRSGLRDHKDPT